MRYYGRLIRDRARKKIGHLYPKVSLPAKHGGGEANIIAWLWARTVASQDPAAHSAHVPLITSYWLANNGARSSWLDPVVDRVGNTYRFEVKTGTPADKVAIRAGTKMGRRAFRCLLSQQPLEYSYTRTQANEQKLGCTLICIVAETKRGRVYLPANREHERLGRINSAAWKPEELVTTPCHDVDRLPMYGMPMWGDAFTPRQLTSLTTLSDLVRGVRIDIKADAQHAGMSDEDSNLYVKTVCTFLALAVDRCADFNNSLCRWSASNQKVINLFGRQAIPMNWDFAEASTLGESVGAWSTCCDYVSDCVEVLIAGAGLSGEAGQVDAANGASAAGCLLVSTDPPYYDNIGYAALSDFFYVWLRRSAGDLYPELFSTMLVPKMRELTASPERFEGDKKKAKDHFKSGFRHAFTKLLNRLDARFPLTVYYAYKQNDEEESGGEDDGGDNSVVDLTTGWETLLEALISSGFQITATWPVRASQKWRMVSMGTNALASYIVLACRPRSTNALQIASTQFRQELKRSLPSALRHLQQGNIAPVDFAQAALGPGMAAYSQYSRILENSGRPMSVRAAINIINQTLSEVLSELEDDFDSDTRWAIAWFEQNGFDAGDFGDAELLSKAKVTSVSGLQQAGVVASRGGKVRLLRPDELSPEWDPTTNLRTSVWQMTHQLLRRYHHDQAGDAATAALLRKLGSDGELARELAYRLFNIAGKKKLSQEAQGYNALVLGWPEIARIAREMPAPAAPTQGQLI